MGFGIAKQIGILIVFSFLVGSYDPQAQRKRKTEGRQNVMKSQVVDGVVKDSYKDGKLRAEIPYANDFSICASLSSEPLAIISENKSKFCFEFSDRKATFSIGESN
ncbi:MAG: hypothetical protein ACK4RF_05930 [Cyclobacteriaceae bacterium]